MFSTETMTIPQMFFDQVNRFGKRPALLHKKGESYEPINWSEMGEMVRETAGGLIEIGVEPGDRVAIMSYNRPEWIIADLAILAIGGITIPVYHTNTSTQINYIFKHSGAKVAFIARSEKAEMLATCDAAVQKIISLDPIGIDSPGPCALDYPALRQLGREGLSKKLNDELTKRLTTVHPNDCATIIFTSGTTGDPKGVMLTHANILANASASLEAQPVGPEDTCLSFLPLSHSFERTVGQFLMILAGATIAYASSIRAVADNMREVRPTIMLGVPRFYEKLYNRVTEAVQNAPAIRKKLFYWAMRVGRRTRYIDAQGGSPGIFLLLQHKLADKLIFAKLKARLGGRLRFFISGGAPLDKGIIEFFLNAGVHILEGYGLTEYSPVIAVNRLNNMRPGTVGLPIPGCEIKISSDSEVLVKGPSIMLGYYNDEQATAQVVQDGWLATGDLGVLENGFLKIHDRKKDIIVTSGGKNISPQYIENLLITDEYISQAVLYGDNKNFLSGLIVPEYEHFAKINPVESLTGLSAQELAERIEFNDFMMSRITEKSANLALFERVRKVVILSEPFTEGHGEMTPTMKVKRKAVILKHQNELDALYEKETKEKPRNRWP